MLRELAGATGKSAAARPEDFVDLTFIKELDGSGFIDRLYKTTPVVASREEPRAIVTAKEKPPSPVDKTKSVATATSAAAGQGYTVEPGDTLSGLARKHYGNALQWEKIFQANKATMKNPDYIYVGQTIIIPS